jgi:hypothetical protein
MFLLFKVQECRTLITTILPNDYSYYKMLKNKSYELTPLFNIGDLGLNLVAKLDFCIFAILSPIPR